MNHRKPGNVLVQFFQIEFADEHRPREQRDRGAFTGQKSRARSRKWSREESEAGEGSGPASFHFDEGILIFASPVSLPERWIKKMRPFRFRPYIEEIF